MLGTKDFAVLSAEELEHVSGGKATFLTDSTPWPIPSEYSIGQGYLASEARKNAYVYGFLP